MRDHSLATTAQRSGLQLRLRWTAALALCLSCAAISAGANDSQPANTPAIATAEPGQFLAAPIEQSLAERDWLQVVSRCLRHKISPGS